MLWIYLIVILIIVIWGGVTNWKFISNGRQYYNSKYTINNVFDKVYVINLDSQPENLKNIDKQLKKYNIKYSRFKAINGKDVFDQYNLSKDSWNNDHPGALGCLLSHKTIIKDALDNNYNKILILEDDCLLHKNFNNIFNQKYESLINYHPEWKILYFGNSHQYGWPFSIKYYDNFYFTKEGYSTFAYGLDKSMFEDLLKSLENIDDPIDDSLVNNYQENNLCITFYPHIIQQDIAQESTTTGISWNLKDYFEDNRVKLENFID